MQEPPGKRLEHSGLEGKLHSKGENSSIRHLQGKRILRQTDSLFHLAFVLIHTGREMAKAELRASAEAVRLSEAVFTAQRHDMEQAILAEASALHPVPDSHLLGDGTDGEIPTTGTLPREWVPTGRLTAARVPTAQEHSEPELAHGAMADIEEFLGQFMMTIWTKSTKSGAFLRTA